MFLFSMWRLLTHQILILWTFFFFFFWQTYPLNLKGYNSNENFSICKNRNTIFFRTQRRAAIYRICCIVLACELCLEVILIFFLKVKSFHSLLFKAIIFFNYKNIWKFDDIYTKNLFHS